MLQEVRQSALAGLLENAAHALGNVEVGQSRLLGVVTDVIGKSVLQFTLADGGVLRQSLGRCRERQQREG